MDEPWDACAVFKEVPHHTRCDDEVACCLHCYRGDEKGYLLIVGNELGCY